MIVVAIIALLASFAVPLYQGYVVKSQVGRAVSEISSYKTAFELRANQGGSVTNSDLGYVPSGIISFGGGDIGVINPDGSAGDPRRQCPPFHTWFSYQAGTRHRWSVAVSAG